MSWKDIYSGGIFGDAECGCEKVEELSLIREETERDVATSIAEIFFMFEGFSGSISIWYSLFEFS